MNDKMIQNQLITISPDSEHQINDDDLFKFVFLSSISLVKKMNPIDMLNQSMNQYWKTKQKLICSTFR